MSSTICPRDGRVCIDDLCRGCGICALTGSELWDQCDRCGGIYSNEFGVECACEPDDDYGDFDEHDCGEDTCVCEDHE